MVGGLSWPLATVLALGLACPVTAHEAGKAWTYPLACCKGTQVGGDCHSIPRRDVMEGRRGYIIQLMPGDHPKATVTHVFMVPYGDEIPSGDGDFHLCLHPTEDHLNCFFAPPSGM